MTQEIEELFEQTYWKAPFAEVDEIGHLAIWGQSFLGRLAAHQEMRVPALIRMINKLQQAHAGPSVEQQHRQRVAFAKDSMQHLRQLACVTEPRPLVPECRPSYWFRDEQEVVVVADGVTRRGVIRDSSRYIVVDHVDGKTGCYGPGRPELLHLSEYEYLRDNPFFLGMWLGSVSHYNGYGDEFNTGEFYQSLLNGYK